MPGKKDLLTAVAAHGGIATRQQLLQTVDAATLDAGTRRRWVTRVHPHTYVPTSVVVTDLVRARAALRYAVRGAAISHVSALARYAGNALADVVHVTVDHGRRLAGSPCLRVHRRVGFRAEPPLCRSVRGLLVTEPARTVVDSWPSLPVRDRRPAAIDVVRRGTTTAEELAAALATPSSVAGHVELRRTIALIADGVRSELEALGVLGVFQHADLPASQGQRRVEVAGRRFTSIAAGRRPDSSSSSTGGPTTPRRRTGGRTWSATASSRRPGGWCSGSPTPTSCGTPPASGPRCSPSTARASAGARSADRSARPGRGSPCRQQTAHPVRKGSRAGAGEAGGWGSPGRG